MAKQAKGAAFERQVCKDLSLWWTNGQRDDVFYRTSNSGGRATTRAKKGQSTANQHGDICCTDPIGQPLMDLLTFEIKRGYSSNTIADLLDYPDHAALQRWEKWIHQAERSQREAGSVGWAIIAKRDQRLPLIAVEASVMEELNDYHSFYGCRFHAKIRNENKELTTVQMEIVGFDQFLSEVSPNWIHQIVKGWQWKFDSANPTT